ncbi:hypothetical protein VE25_02845 [Devosia geojensis]|uniref:MalT-like TPR region domain-containing protein n=2 Tax=Devosia geojensis TaxID=443610 RepID=A0A0F5FYM2_9HYPH|nr:hypothetical protein VE25_02845 [Devosia geojensis]
MRPAEAGSSGQLDAERSKRADRLAAMALRNDDAGLLVEAVIEYRQLISMGAGGIERAGIEHNLGVAMCLIGQRETDPAQAAAAFELARRHLESALLVRTRADAPQAWALTQANLAIVHLSNHRLTGDPAEAMAGHVALDGAQEIFRQMGKGYWTSWIASIRAHLLKAGDRRRVLR